MKPVIVLDFFVNIQYKSGLGICGGSGGRVIYKIYQQVKTELKTDKEREKLINEAKLKISQSKTVLKQVSRLKYTDQSYITY